MTLPRVYPILDTASLRAAQCPVFEAAQGLLDAGASILQLRHKGHWDREFFEDADRIQQLCRATGCLFVTNDRADMAALLDSALHVGQNDLAPVDARLIIGQRPLGFSTHNAAQLEAAAAEPIDYVALGPIFGTTSKQNPDPVVGLERLRDWRRLTNKSLVAVGGITRLKARSVWDAGADSAAVISDLLPSPCTRSSIRERMREWLDVAEIR